MKPLDVQQLVEEGKSLGEIQLAIQERKPYWKAQKKFEEEEEVKKQNILIKKLSEDPFKDPMEEMVDQFANDAEERDREREHAAKIEEERKANATRDAAKKVELEKQLKDLEAQKKAAKEADEKKKAATIVPKSKSDNSTEN